MSETIDYLKGLVAQLNEKIEKLEAQTNVGRQKPFDAAKELRMILIGPPGAGESLFFPLALSDDTLGRLVPELIGCRDAMLFCEIL